MDAMDMVGAEDWAQQHFGQAELGDKRRTGRAVRLAARMVQHPAGSIPQQVGNFHQAKAAYRLFEGEDVTFEALVEPHWQQTRREAGTRGRVWMIQDTMVLDYTAHWGTTGLGPIGDGRGRGLLQHSVWAVDPCKPEEVLGLAYAQLKVRKPKVAGETRTQRMSRRRESAFWPDGVKAVGSSPEGSRWIHVCDREGDTFELFSACEQHGVGYWVRAAQDRRVGRGHDAAEPTTVLLQHARSLRGRGSLSLVIRKRRNRRKRVAELRVGGSSVTVFRPGSAREKSEPIRAWVIRVWEVNGPKDEEPIEWILLCSERVETASEAIEVARWYSLRWVIEEYPKCEKTGCSVESRQLHEASRLEPLIGMLSVVAVMLLQLKRRAKVSPEEPATESVSKDHVGVLAAYRNEPIEKYTTHHFWREVARLGGFLARKSDGDPGWQTIWCGWQKLDLMVLGARIVRSGPGAEKCG